MLVYVTRNELYYDLENLIAIFVKKSQLSFTEAVEVFEHALSNGDDALMLKSSEMEFEAIFYKGGIMVGRFATSYDHRPSSKRQIKKNLYQMLEKFYDPMSKWGILVGIRPVKIVHELLDEGKSYDAIEEILLKTYLMKPEKASLLMEIAKRERPHLYPIDSNAISIYICIPFCPSRCLYCSFPSNDVSKKGKLMAPYVQKLISEIEYVSDKIRDQNYLVDCIYVGGGTPTALTEVELQDLMDAITRSFDIKNVKEFTVEAGRPDSITDIKLKTLKNAGVSRLCVNPQSMRDQTLVQIGRKHTAGDIKAMMVQARAHGFDNINMDLIMGLPGETLEDANQTISEVIEMAPENVTIHTLSVKRASRLNEQIEQVELAHDQTVEAMMSSSVVILRQHGISPYYMYRQKKMIGHLENIGFAKEGYESLYNMRIMEERHTIIALGAGAVSKICHADENRFERVANFKGVEDYLERFGEVIERKKEAFIALKK